MTSATFRWLIVLLASWVMLSATNQHFGVAAESDATYVGAGKCMKCHRKKAAGAQYRLWKASAHASAYETLGSEKALAEGKKRGIEDPQKSKDCLKCHVTAFAVMDELDKHDIKIEEGVSCESCHGAGSGYIEEETMKGVAEGKIKPASVGLLQPTEETCVQCHTPEGNPFYKEFDFEKALKAIAHPTPK